MIINKTKQKQETRNKKQNQYPLIKNNTVMKPCKPASGINQGFNLLHNSIGLI